MSIASPIVPIADVEAATRAESIRRSLADEIITGRLAPGTRLDEVGTAERFAVSRTPVREALNQLVGIGLAQRQGRGLVVAQLAPAMVTEAFELMADLEALCAHYAAQRMTPVERRLLAQIHERAGEAMRHGVREDYDALNTEFHAAIYRGSHNRPLEDAAHAARRRVAPYRTGQFNVSGRLARSFGEHALVVEAIQRGEAARAAAHVRAHVHTVSDASLTYVAAARAR
ncbi:MAG: GntR family transcriptional regulator [Alphaproteobacteria bacterium]|nr:GntR family transcriptional regulator [Alphaproteobacteria bacterium]MCW5740327.1 GntR family transcriptional regulator [Alphaproteobacteria bacterium]